MVAKKTLALIVAAAFVWTNGAPPALAAAAQPVTIGVAAAVKGLVRAVPTGSSAVVGRVIQSGKPLYLNEHVTTGPGGHLQIMLEDETIFTIGPNSDVVLDKFVYDPDTHSGKVSATVSKGVFRFITGNIGKKDPSSMEVKLPAGTIGIRGTIVAGHVIPGGASTAILLGPGSNNPAGERPGAFTLNNTAGSVRVDRPGFGTTVSGIGLPPTPPVLIPADQMRGILGDLAPKTMADRAERGKQALADRLVEKLAQKGDGKRDEDDKDLAEKLVTGKPLTRSERAAARDGLARLSEPERRLAEKLLAGDRFTPEEHHMATMMAAGEELVKTMDPVRMTPEQMKLAESMMMGTLTPEQQKALARTLTPEQQSLLGSTILPPPGGEMPFTPFGYKPPSYDPSRPPAYPGAPPPDGTAYKPPEGMPMYNPDGTLVRSPDGMPMYNPDGTLAYMDPKYATMDPYATGPYGDLSTFGTTTEFFGTYDPLRTTIFFDPSQVPNGLTDGPSTWDDVRNRIVTGTGIFPGRTGNFGFAECAGSCTSQSGSWGFSNVTIDFGARTISGTASITATANAGAINVNVSENFNVNYGTLSGGAIFPVTSGDGYAHFTFGLGNMNGNVAQKLVGDVRYDKPGPIKGAGEHLESVRPQ